MIRMIRRWAVAIAVTFLLAIAGVKVSAAVLQTLFTVLGIVFSISMSLLVSFSLAKVLNNKIRNKIRDSISHTRNMLLLDFGISTVAAVVALIWDEQQPCILVKGDYVMLLGFTFVATSLMYEIYNFSRLHILHTDIEDAVIAEETSKAEKEL